MMSIGLTVQRGGNLQAGEVAIPSLDELRSNARKRYGALESAGRNVRKRLAVGYFSPPEHYEALLEKLIHARTRWLDIGCGRSPLPGNERLANELANRCAKLVGVDPDETIRKNPYLHQAVQQPFEDFDPDESFELITLRMVCEHAAQPERLVQKLSEVAADDAHVVILTPSRFAVASLAAQASPHMLHHACKAALWGTCAEDTFPVCFRMNTRRRLRSLMREGGFGEVAFQRLADACLFWKLPRVHSFELSAWHALPRRFRALYPDACLLAVYARAV